MVCRLPAEPCWQRAIFAGQAIFGFYTPTLRRTDLIAGQVRLLASLLAKAGETTVSSVLLATDLDGTYVPRASARTTSRGSPSPGP